MELEEVPCIIQRICAPSIQLSLTASPPLYLPYMYTYCMHTHTSLYTSLTRLIAVTCTHGHGPIIFQTPVQFLLWQINFHLSLSLIKKHFNMQWADVSLDLVVIISGCKVAALSNTLCIQRWHHLKAKSPEFCETTQKMSGKGLVNEREKRQEGSNPCSDWTNFNTLLSLER